MSNRRLMMDNIEIPEFNDPEWQVEMLKLLDEKLDALTLEIASDEGQELLDEAEMIVDALRQYSGY